MDTPNIVCNLKEKVVKLAMIHQMSHKINSMTDLDSLIAYTLDQALETLSSESGSLFLWDEKEKELSLVINRGRNADLKGLKKRLGQDVTGKVAELGQPIIVRNIHDDRRFTASAGAENRHQYKTDSFLCVPLTVNNALVGVISVSEKEDGTAYTEDELEFLYILSNHAAIAIHNMQLLRHMKEFNRELKETVEKARVELKQSLEEQYVLKTYKENILESIRAGIFVVNLEGTITLWNKSMEIHYHIPQEQVMGKSVAEVLQEKGAQVLLDAIRKVIARGEPMTLEKVHHAMPVHRQTRTVNYTVTPLYTNEGTGHAGAVVIYDDITEKLELEKELRVSERLALIGKLASGLAHELNNPLDGTRRYINLSLTQLGTGVEQNVSLAQEYLLSAKDGINRMINVVRSLLDFSRQTGTQQKRVIDVNQAIEDALKLVMLQQPLTGIIIQKNLSAYLPSVVDYSLQTVFTNLIDNAIDAMPEGGTITLESRMVGDEVEVVVRDTGIGIEESALDQIFDPFFTTKPRSEGTGLGLAICHEIIKRSQGSIRVESMCGKGTTFIITLPGKKE